MAATPCPVILAAPIALVSGVSRLGEALVRAADESELKLSVPQAVRGDPGQGIRGVVDRRTAGVGSHPVAGALPQEGIEPATILDALRARRG